MSLSLDFTNLLANAGTIINGLWPVFIFPVGIALGVGLLNKIVQMIQRIL